VCMAKTQNSLSDDSKKLGRPRGFTVTVRDAKLAAGAGFIVAYAGDILTMPGLPKVPGAETMDVDPHRPKAVWGFNGTERPGAVYLAAVLAAHNQKGLPAFGIYGREVRDADDESIPDDVVQRLLRFSRAGLAVALMRGRTYLSLGGVSMGIAGSIVDHDFFGRYLGLRVQSLDMTELIRRIQGRIYDRAGQTVVYAEMSAKETARWLIGIKRVDRNAQQQNPEGRE